MSEGFDDIEMKNRNMEEEEEERETSFGGDDLEDNPEGHNRSINIINTENPKRKFNRVDRASSEQSSLSRETPENISRRMRNVKSIITKSSIDVCLVRTFCLLTCSCQNSIFCNLIG